MSATDRPVGCGYGRRYGYTRIVDPTENDVLVANGCEPSYTHHVAQDKGGRRRSPMKWIAAAAMFSLVALGGLKTSVVSREDTEDTTVFQAQDRDAGYLAQFEVRRNEQQKPSIP